MKSDSFIRQSNLKCQNKPLTANQDMPTKLIDGKAIASDILTQLQQQIRRQQSSGLRSPALATILVGNDPASEIYVRNKLNACTRTGILSRHLQLPEKIDQQTLLDHIEHFNNDDSIDGILVQLPLPSHINSTTIIERIRAEKDVDGFHPYNIGRLAQRIPALRPCTPAGVIELLKRTDETFYGRNACIVGASNHVGRPMALELLLAGATVTVCHRFTKDLAQHVSGAEILIAAAGHPGLIDGHWVREGATVIDVGITRGQDGSLIGDVIHETALGRARWLTPVPGGVGPMTVAMLMRKTIEAQHRKKGLRSDCTALNQSHPHGLDGQAADEQW